MLDTDAEALVRPAQDDGTLRRAIKVSLADGFALATARVQRASIASFDERVKRAAGTNGIQLAPALG